MAAGAGLFWLMRCIRGGCPCTPLWCAAHHFVGGLVRDLLAYASPRFCPVTPAPEGCKFQNGHGRPWFQTDGLVFDKDVKN
ncbi:hypothetical protein DWQ65_08130 [Treponema phagedenis]|nr:hypothetical protein DWQ65_08130 [Treponema phagedenis]